MSGTISVTITLPRITHVSISDDTLTVDLEDGRTISVPIAWYPRLAYRTPAERSNFQISSALWYPLAGSRRRYWY